MGELTLLFALLTKEREQQATKLTAAKAMLRTLVSRIGLDVLLTLIATKCGNDISYRYPKFDDLGITVDLLASDEPAAIKQIDKSLALAVQESLQRKGHIRLLLNTFKSDNDETVALRIQATQLANDIIECCLRISQIDILTPLLLNNTGGEMSMSQIADLFCNS